MHEAAALALSSFDTCTLSDAIDKLGLHLHNQGFATPGLRHLAGTMPPGASGIAGCVAGYAATARVRSFEPPMTGHFYFHHTDWWDEINSLPEPRVVVIEDIDRIPGIGACVGLVATAAYAALHCQAAVTNGSCRDIPAVHAMNFQLFGAHVSPSRAYAHLVDHHQPVSLFGLSVRPGDLLAVDGHGLLAIPPEHAGDICARAAERAARKRSFVDYCASPDFSIEGLQQQLRQLHS